MAPVSMLRKAFHRDHAALVSAVLALILVGAVLNGAFLARTQQAIHQRVTEGASLLAQEAFAQFAEAAVPEELAALAPGQDTIVTRRWVLAGEAVQGGYSVRVARLDDVAFVVKSTGRLAAGGRPVICSTNVVWRIDDWQSRARALDGRRPLCNGSPTASSLTLRSLATRS
jgi:hypothetical protein